MLDKEFDQYFRDRLLDHPSKVHLSMWKRVHTHLLQHKAFHFWKWYVVGPTAVVVAVTGHFILSTLHSTAHTTPKTAAVATYDTRPVTDSAAGSVTGSTVAASAAGSAAVAGSAVASDSAATGSAATTLPPNPAMASTAAATKPAPSTSATSAMRTAGITSASATTKASTATRSTTRYHPSRHNPRSAGDGTATQTTHGSRHSGLASTHGHHLNGVHLGTGGDTDALTPDSETNAGTTNKNAPHPPVPAQLIAPAKVVTLKTPPAIAVKTPNSKSPHQLTLPARPYRKGIPMHLDVFAGPEHFTWNTVGLSFGAGAQLTLVFKNHWTVTSGLQYQRINVNHVGQVDSISGLLPGYFSNLQIPLLFGYTMANDRYSLAVKAGPIWNLASQAHRSLANADNWPNHSWNAYLGINFSSRVTDRISLFAEPYVRCWFPPGDIRLPPQLWSTGLMLGIRYNF